MIGVDIISIDRMVKFIDKFEEKALLRFLDKDEIKLCKSNTTVAGFWAAKEAASKALGTGIGKECGFKDIKISKSPKGAPLIKLSKKVANNFNIKDISVSISHDSGFAIAVVAMTTH